MVIAAICLIIQLKSFCNEKDFSSYDDIHCLDCDCDHSCSYTFFIAGMQPGKASPGDEPDFKNKIYTIGSGG